jgi:hypothetical protein
MRLLINVLFTFCGRKLYHVKNQTLSTFLSRNAVALM